MDDSQLLDNVLKFNIKSVKKILSKTNVDTKDSFGTTPLNNLVIATTLFPTFKKNDKAKKMIKFLVESGANVNTKNNFGNRPIHRIKFHDITKTLIDLGADVNVRNGDGKTPLHNVFTAYLKGKIKPLVGKTIAESLVKAGADVNAKDTRGNTPLHVLAVLIKNPVWRPTAKLFAENGADLSIKNNDGQTPMDIGLRPTILKKIFADFGTKPITKDKNSCDKKTVRELRAMASDKKIKGRSKMNKKQLCDVLKLNSN